METLLDDLKIKNLFKQALIETLEEKQAVVHDLFMDVIEDIAMIKAIDEGKATDRVSRDAVFNLLNS